MRIYWLDKRKKINTHFKKEIDKKLLKLFIKSFLSLFNVYHCFLPINHNNEFNTYLLIQYLLNHNKIIVVPKLGSNNNLEHYYFQKSTKLINNHLSIPEPVNASLFFPFELIDVVLVPLIVCDNNGNRIGYGKGYYDKFLSSLKKSTLKIGINIFNCIDDKIPKEFHDITLDYLISPAGIKKFNINY